MVKAPALGAGDCEFEPRHPDILFTKYKYSYIINKWRI